MTNNESLSWLPSRQKEEIEEALGIIFKASEEGITDSSKIGTLFIEEIGKDMKDALAEKGLAKIEGEKISLTESGKKDAHTLIRRCRLSERLLADVIDVRSDQLDSAACQFEHVLSEEITDSICTLLGHPTECPHEHPIPPGKCCGTSESTIPSVVTSLSQLKSHTSARVAYLLFKRNPEAYRLMSLGLVPGKKIKLLQRVPNFVLEVGESQIALDESLAKDIYVRKLC